MLGTPIVIMIAAWREDLWGGGVGRAMAGMSVPGSLAVKSKALIRPQTLSLKSQMSSAVLSRVNITKSSTLDSKHFRPVITPQILPSALHNYRPQMVNHSVLQSPYMTHPSSDTLPSRIIRLRLAALWDLGSA